jgi:hypothetical protein
VLQTEIAGYERLEGCIPLAMLCCSDICATVYGQRIDRLNRNYVSSHEVDTLHQLGAVCDVASLHALDNEHM